MNVRIIPILCCAGVALAGHAGAGTPQTIPAVNIVVKAPDAAPFALPAVASSGLPITWQSLVGPATVAGNTVTLTGATGSVTLRGRQAGDATYDPAPDRYETFVVEVGGGFVKIAAGEAHVVGIRSDGHLWTWGRNYRGQLGDGTVDDRATPTQIAGSTVWTGVACGSSHTVALRSDGTLWAWGSNSDGELGLGNLTDRSFPVQIGTLTTWTDIACGAGHTLARRSDGSLWAWGDNAHGQLGDGTIGDRNVPTRVGAALDWVEIAGGSTHSIGRRAGGSIWTWGGNAYGQLGDGTFTRRLAPVRVGTASDWAEVSAGAFFSAGRRTGGTIWTWGNNDSGQLGNDTRTESATPLQVGTDTDWSAVSCGAACVIARKTDTWMWAWGDNSAGQLGDLTTLDRLLPVRTMEGPWGSVTVGAACVLAVRNEQLWTWGTNDNNQLALPPEITGAAAVPPAPRLPLRSPQNVLPLPTIAAQSGPLPTAVGSALPPVVTVISGPAVVSADGISLTFTGEGAVVVEVFHPGDGAWHPAPAQTFTIQADGTGPVFTDAPATRMVQLESPGGTVVNFTAAAVDAVTGPAPVVCDPPSGSLFPGGVTTVTCTAQDAVGNVTIHSFKIKVNRPPVADSGTVSGAAPPLIFTLGATDPDGDTLAFSVLTAPSNGTLSGTIPDLTFSPNPGFIGTTTLTFKASDGSAESAPATMTLQVMNAAPVANPQSLATSAFAALPATLTGSDLNGQGLTFSVVTPPVKGNLSGTPPNLTYTPSVGAEGPDSFTFRAFDGTDFSEPATISILVNDAPSAPARNLTTPEDTALPITLTGTDPNGHPLTFSIVTPPAHGTLSGTGAAVTYAPAANYNGPDGFTYRVNDGYSDSAPELVSIGVQPSNDAPVALPQSVSPDEDTPLPITLTGTDVENSPLTFTVTVPPAHGTLTGAAPNLAYTPAANYAGPDSFSFTVNDGDLTSAAAAVVDVNVAAVNDPPVADPVAVSAFPPVSFTLSGSDVENSPLTFSIVTPPASGTLSGTPPNLTFSPAPGFLGPISFTYRANDGSADSAPATVTLTVLNAAPEAANLDLATGEDIPLPVTLTGTDANEQPLTFVILTPPAHGTLTGSPPNLTYTPDENTFGPDSFTYKVNDGLLDSNTATVSIAVAPVNDPPVTAFDVFSVNEDTLLTVAATKSLLLNDSDFHDGALAENNHPITSVLDIAPPHAASFTLNANGTFSYLPKPNFHGLDSFTYRAVDADGAASDPETVLIAVRAVNDAPVAATQSATTLEDVSRTIRLRSADADLLYTFDPSDWIGVPPPNNGPAPHDADPIYAITTPPQHGTLTGTAPNLVYTPAANYHGADSFTFTASDGLATSAAATVTITVLADADGDALPDEWEFAAFASTEFTGADDPDHDGQNNTFEYIAGSLPADPTSCLCVEQAASGVFRLDHVQPGVIYQLESSDELQVWQPAATVEFELIGPGMISDPMAGSYNRRFYRVSVSTK